MLNTTIEFEAQSQKSIVRSFCKQIPIPFHFKNGVNGDWYRYAVVTRMQHRDAGGCVWELEVSTASNTPPERYVLQYDSFERTGVAIKLQD